MVSQTWKWMSGLGQQRKAKVAIILIRHKSQRQNKYCFIVNTHLCYYCAPLIECIEVLHEFLSSTLNVIELGD